MTSVNYAVSDALAMTKRNLTRYVRIPTLLVFSTIQPIMFVLLFVYVFGGAVKGSLPPGTKYVEFLMPGIFVQTVVFGSTQTGVGLAEDLSKGMIDRFRSLPMARSAVLAGRTLGDSVRNTFVVVLMTVVGVLVGFRFLAGFVPAVAALVLVVAFGFAFTWISAMIGLAVHDVESAQTAGFIWVFPLVFASTVFVPLSSMPGWLQAFARINPITCTANAVRALTLGGPTTLPVLYSLAWIVGILVVFMPLATRNYRRVA
ncbi:MAG TPA: ABC transporter permease [Acidimicrobiales bacterium]|jgi:ABC-2 type transport system permease protein/oleandomycin transport system permease protein